MNKKEIRTVFLQKRLLLSELEIIKGSTAIIGHFNRLQLSNINAVFSYSPISHHKEFDVGACERSLSATHPGITIAHPRIIKNAFQMEAVRIENSSSFAENQYLIREPSEGEILPPDIFDLVLVPLLAIDVDGFRIGYGKGYYDRWLPQCRPEVIKVGFSFFEPVAPVGDISEFDVPLNFCITPMRVYEF